MFEAESAAHSGWCSLRAPHRSGEALVRLRPEAVTESIFHMNQVGTRRLTAVPGPAYGQLFPVQIDLQAPAWQIGRSRDRSRSSTGRRPTVPHRACPPAALARARNRSASITLAVSEQWLATRTDRRASHSLSCVAHGACRPHHGRRTLSGSCPTWCRHSSGRCSSRVVDSRHGDGHSAPSLLRADGTRGSRHREREPGSTIEQPVDVDSTAVGGVGGLVIEFGDAAPQVDDVPVECGEVRAVVAAIPGALNDT